MPQKDKNEDFPYSELSLFHIISATRVMTEQLGRQVEMDYLYSTPKTSFHETSNPSYIPDNNSITINT